MISSPLNICVLFARALGGARAYLTISFIGDGFTANGSFLVVPTGERIRRGYIGKQTAWPKVTNWGIRGGNQGSLIEDQRRNRPGQQTYFNNIYSDDARFLQSSVPTSL